jgi:hypothetical protein
MYRQRRKKLHKRRRAALVVASAAVLALAIAIPTFASASGVSNLIGQAGAGGSGGSSGSSGTSTVTPNAGVPPTYTPPLHGTNPHGQGTDAVVDIQPSNTNPYAGDPSSNPPGTGEEVIAGDSRGEQTASGYQGKVTLLYLFGNPIVQVTSNPGETNHGPLQPLQTQLLDQICQGSGGQLCLTVLRMDSSSTGNSSTNSFLLLGADIGGASGLHLRVLGSDGNISDDGSTQTAHGDSNVASLAAGDQHILDALQGDSTSTAGPGSSSVDQHSTVLALGGNGLPIPTGGCDNGTPNTNFVPLSPLLAAVCNADDTNGSQTSAPYGVREALTLFALISGNSSLLKVTTAGPESHAVAPGAGGGPGGGQQGTAGAGGKGGNGGNNGGNGGGAGGAGNGGGAGAAAGNAGAGGGNLAFTGADLLALGLVGGALILGGLALTTMAGRRHRQTV